MNFWTAAISLFLIMNIIGNIPLFIGLLSKFSIHRQRRIILREMIVALCILLLFAVFGDKVLHLLRIDKSILQISGGFLLILVSVKMVFPKVESVESMPHEPMIIPLAIPTVAGPGAITTTIIILHTLNSIPLAIGVVLLAWIPSLIIIMAASNIKYLLGERGMIGFERFGGMIVSLIAVHMLVDGIVNAVKANFPVA